MCLQNTSCQPSLLPSGSFHMLAQIMPSPYLSEVLQQRRVWCHQCGQSSDKQWDVTLKHLSLKGMLWQHHGRSVLSFRPQKRTASKLLCGAGVVLGHRVGFTLVLILFLKK